jgi:putative ABC transport system permease protein
VTPFLLGLRLAAAGGRLRAGLVVAGNAVGVVVLLVAASVPGALSDRLSQDDRRLVAVVVLFLLLPVVSLLASVTRLSAAVRDRRLAALRLLGLGAGGTRAVAAGEAVGLSLAGVVVGVATFLVVAGPAVRAGDFAWQSWFDGRVLLPPPLGWLGAVVGVPLLSLVVALAPVHALTRSALQVRRQGSARRPGAWRMVPLAVGLLVLAWGVTRQPGLDRPIPGDEVALFFAGTALTAVSIPLVVPVLVRLVADAGVRWGRSPAALVAARGLQQEPAATTRLVASLLVALFAVAGGRCVLTAFETTPQYVRAERAATTGPQRAYLAAPPGGTLALAAVRAVPGVRAAYPRFSVGTRCSARDQVTFPGGLPTGTTTCGRAFVGTCADLAAEEPGVVGCRDDRPAWLEHGYGTVERTSSTVLAALDAEGGRSGSLALPVDPAPLRVLPPGDDPSYAEVYDLFVPRATPGLTAVLSPPQSWTAVLDGGPRPLAALTAALAGSGVDVQPAEDGRDRRLVDGYRAILYAVAVVVLAVGLTALLVTGIDRAMERRRHLAGLAVLGVPAGVVRRSQLLAALAPLAVGLPLAGGAGLLAGATYLSLGSVRRATPWEDVSLLIAAALAAAVLVAAATVTGLGGRVRPADLRRE